MAIVNELIPGARVQFIDGNGHEHDALVTGVYPDKSVNLVFVDDTLEDSFGKQIARGISVPNLMKSAGDGHFWCWPGDRDNSP